MLSQENDITQATYQNEILSEKNLFSKFSLKYTESYNLSHPDLFTHIKIPKDRTIPENIISCGNLKHFVSVNGAICTNHKTCSHEILLEILKKRTFQYYKKAFDDLPFDNNLQYSFAPGSDNSNINYQKTSINFKNKDTVSKQRSLISFDKTTNNKFYENGLMVNLEDSLEDIKTSTKSSEKINTKQSNDSNDINSNNSAAFRLLILGLTYIDDCIIIKSGQDDQKISLSQCQAYRFNLRERDPSFERSNDFALQVTEIISRRKSHFPNICFAPIISSFLPKLICSGDIVRVEKNVPIIDFIHPLEKSYFETAADAFIRDYKLSCDNDCSLINILHKIKQAGLKLDKLREIQKSNEGKVTRYMCISDLLTKVENYNSPNTSNDFSSLCRFNDSQGLLLRAKENNSETSKASLQISTLKQHRNNDKYFEQSLKPNSPTSNKKIDFLNHSDVNYSLKNYKPSNLPKIHDNHIELKSIIGNEQDVIISPKLNSYDNLCDLKESNIEEKQNKQRKKLKRSNTFQVGMSVNLTDLRKSTFTSDNSDSYISNKLNKRRISRVSLFLYPELIKRSTTVLVRRFPYYNDFKDEDIVDSLNNGNPIKKYISEDEKAIKVVNYTLQNIQKRKRFKRVSPSCRINYSQDNSNSFNFALFNSGLNSLLTSTDILDSLDPTLDGIKYFKNQNNNQLKIKLDSKLSPDSRNNLHDKNNIQYTTTIPLNKKETLKESFDILNNPTSIYNSNTASPIFQESNLVVDTDKKEHNKIYEESNTKKTSCTLALANDLSSYFSALHYRLCQGSLYSALRTSKTYTFIPALPRILCYSYPNYYGETMKISTQKNIDSFNRDFISYKPEPLIHGKLTLSKSLSRENKILAKAKDLSAKFPVHLTQMSFIKQKDISYRTELQRHDLILPKCNSKTMKAVGIDSYYNANESKKNSFKIDDNPVHIYIVLKGALKLRLRTFLQQDRLPVKSDTKKINILSSLSSSFEKDKYISSVDDFEKSNYRNRLICESEPNRSYLDKIEFSSDYLKFAEFNNKADKKKSFKSNKILRKQYRLSHRYKSDNKDSMITSINRSFFCRENRSDSRLIFKFYNFIKFSLNIKNRINCKSCFAKFLYNLHPTEEHNLRYSIIRVKPLNYFTFSSNSQNMNSNHERNHLSIKKKATAVALIQEYSDLSSFNILGEQNEIDGSWKLIEDVKQPYYNSEYSKPSCLVKYLIKSTNSRSRFKEIVQKGELLLCHEQDNMNSINIKYSNNCNKLLTSCFNQQNKKKLNDFKRLSTIRFQENILKIEDFKENSSNTGFNNIGNSSDNYVEKPIDRYINQNSFSSLNSVSSIESLTVISKEKKKPDRPSEAQKETVNKVLKVTKPEETVLPRECRSFLDSNIKLSAGDIISPEILSRYDEVKSITSATLLAIRRDQLQEALSESQAKDKNRLISLFRLFDKEYPTTRIKQSSWLEKMKILHVYHGQRFPVSYTSLLNSLFYSNIEMEIHALVILSDTIESNSPKLAGDSDHETEYIFFQTNKKKITKSAKYFNHSTSRKNIYNLDKDLFLQQAKELVDTYSTQKDIHSNNVSHNEFNKDNIKYTTNNSIFNKSSNYKRLKYYSRNFIKSRKLYYKYKSNKTSKLRKYSNCFTACLSKKENKNFMFFTNINVSKSTVKLSRMQRAQLAAKRYSSTREKYIRLSLDLDNFIDRSYDDDTNEDDIDSTDIFPKPFKPFFSYGKTQVLDRSIVTQIDVTKLLTIPENLFIGAEQAMFGGFSKLLKALLVAALKCIESHVSVSLLNLEVVPQSSGFIAMLNEEYWEDCDCYSTIESLDSHLTIRISQWIEQISNALLPLISDIDTEQVLLSKS